MVAIRRILALTAGIAALLAATWEAAPVQLRDVPPVETSPRTSAAAGRWVIGAAGDIACQAPPNGPSRPETCQHDDTSDLVVRAGLDEVLLLGDNQYERGAYAAYLAYYDPTWGRALANTSPVPGNHEYPGGPSSRPRGYFRYFGDRVKGPHRLGYYSYDLGACPDDPCWHMVALNSELCLGPSGCGPAGAGEDPGPGNRMYAWLRRDLANHPDPDYPCTLAYWHHPLFSFSSGSGPTDAVRPLWELLHAAGADLVLNGHSHNYQRWALQDPSGQADPGGIRQFVVGTGGRSHYAIPGGPMPENLLVAQADAFGVLRITLRAEGYRWAWVTAAGQPSFEDASDGVEACVRVTP